MRLLATDGPRHDASDLEPYLMGDAPEPPGIDIVDVDGLILDRDAEPPATKLIELYKANPKFAHSWERRRNDIDQSASGYDMSLASIAAQAGWSAQAILNLLIAWRRRHNDRPEKALRVDYVQRTIGKALDHAREVREGPRFSLGQSGAEGVDPLRFKLTDSGNAELFAALNADNLRYDHARKRWLLWADHWWRPDTDGEVYRLTKDAARARHRRAIELDDAAQKEAICRWAIQSEGRTKLDAAIHLARNEKPLADAGLHWDTVPWLLGVANGVVDLRAGTLRDGRQSDRITTRAGAPFDPTAGCPRWERFLQEVFGGDAHLIDFIHRAIGYSLSGDTREEVIFFLYGTGRNGKSKLLTALGDYAHNLPFSALELQARSSIPSDIAALAGKRFVSASEITEGARLNEARVKALTGNDPITARYMYEDFFTFRPVAKYWLAVNHKPVVRDDSLGFWNRVRLIPFVQQFTGDAADRTLEATLSSEAAGILAWAVRGCLEWQRRGLEPPDSVTAATADYRDESDPVGTFLLDRCVVRPDCKTPAGELFKAYRQWAEDQGVTKRDVLTQTAFGTRISARFDKVRAARGVTYQGVGLVTEHDECRDEGLDVGFSAENQKIPLGISREGEFSGKPTQPYNPSPILEAEPGIEDAARCGCGQPLPPGHRYRCQACIEDAYVAARMDEPVGILSVKSGR